MSPPCVDALFLSSTRLLDISHIRSLTLRFTDGLVVRQMLEICGKSIYSFNIYIREENANDKSDFGFQHLQYMTSLTISLSIQPSSSAHQTSPIVSWLAMTIRTLPSLEHLEHLTVIFDIWWTSDWSEAHGDPSDAPPPETP